MSLDDILDALQQAVLEVRPDVDPISLSRTTSLRDLGLNSMERAEVIMTTLSHLRLRLPMTGFAQARDLGQIAALMHAALMDAAR